MCLGRAFPSSPVLPVRRLEVSTQGAVALPPPKRRAVTDRAPPMVRCPPMRRLVRGLFTLCSAIALVLAVVVASARTVGTGKYLRDGSHVRMRGELLFAQGDFWGKPVDRYISVAGFHYARGGQGGEACRLLLVPRWSVFPLFAAGLAAPAAAVWLRRRAALAKAAGLCPACGYDLRASPERCPECGTVAPAKGVA